jgi:DNA-binding NtrC family response regulator
MPMNSRDTLINQPLDVPGDMSPRRHVPDADTTATRPPMLAAGPVGALSLALFDGVLPAQTKTIALDRPLTFGRAEPCDIIIADASLSRAHARLTPTATGALLTDLGSSNGTFVGGRRVKEAAIEPGALVRVGDTLLRLQRLSEHAAAPVDGSPFVGGHSIAGVRRMISLVGPTELPVLILGETGTGKEVAARMLHNASGRRGPFIAVNCAALPESLVESELFGHTRGAFTDAGAGRKGLFAAAAGGTLFLDEVGDIPANAQAKLLRVLEDGLVRAVGSEQAKKIDVRILSATNRDLGEAVAQKAFRADLFARLSTVELRTPPLRTRTEDLPALVAHLLARSGRAPLPVSGDALEAMALYDWPQNVRELDNVVRAAALRDAVTLAFDHLPERIQQALRRARGDVATAGVAPGTGDRRTQIEEALRLHGGNVRRASQSLGLARSHVYRLIERWHLDPDRFRAPGTDVAEPGDE